MSVFSENGQTSTNTQAEQQVQGTEQQSSFLAKLVEAKGDNWKDPEVLAKGKLEADSYIEQLEGQLKQLREDLSKESYAEKLLQEIRGKATEPNTVNSTLPKNNTVGTANEGTPASLSEEDLKSLVNKALLEREQRSSVQQNLSAVERELTEKFGTDAQATVKKKSEELGISLKRMEEIASESPTAFFALIGEKRQATNPMVNGSVRTEGVAFTNSNERDWSYYQKLRRENKSLYYTPKVQQQLMEDKARLGVKFGL